MDGFDVVRPPMREITDSDRCSLLHRPLACSIGTSRGANTVYSMMFAPLSTAEERSKAWRSW